MSSATSRPALRAAIIFAAGIILGSRIDPPVGLLLATTLLLVGLFFCLRLLHRTSRVALTLLCLALLSGACLRHEVHTRLFPPEHIIHLLENPQAVTIRGLVVSDPVPRDDHIALMLEVRAIQTVAGWSPIFGRILATIKNFDGHLTNADEVVLQGRLRAPRQARNPGEFDYRAYLSRQSVHALLTLKPESILLVKKRAPGLSGKIVGWVREHLHRAISQTVTGPPAALLLGILLGERSQLPAELSAAFAEAGVIHVLAVSGLHVGLIAGIFYCLLLTLRLPDPLATFVTLATLFLYMYVVDLRPSVVRATVMAAVVMMGRLLERDSDLLNTIACAAMVILIWNPLFLFDIGFQLSFTATISIVSLQGRLKELVFPFIHADGPRWGRWIAAGFSVSLAAQLGTLPIVAYHFQKVPLISLVANLAVVPLVGLALALGLASALLAPLSLALAKLYGATNGLVLTLVIRLVELAAAVPHACLTVPRPHVEWIAGYYLFVLSLVRLKRSRAARRCCLWGALMAINLLVWWQVIEGPQPLQVLFFDVGQGDAALVRFPNGRTMLVDGGEGNPRYDCGTRMICPYLRRAGIGRLDVVVLTHADNDHVGGLPAVLEEIPVGMVLDSGAKHLSRTYLRFLALAKQPTVDYRQVRVGDRLNIDNHVQVNVLGPSQQFITPEGEAPLGLNNASVVIWLGYKEVSFLLTGDIEKQAEEALLRIAQPLNSSVLKVPHHGSISSSSEPFVLAVQPAIAVISVGAENKFGHPHPLVLERYARQKARLFRTDRDGAVIVETNGQQLEAVSMLGQSRGHALADDDEADRLFENLWAQ